MNSLWQKTVNLPSFPTLDGDIKTDVLIIGGGIAGILCANALKDAGVEYVLLEADKICNHTTANTTAKITSQHGFIYSELIRRFDCEKAAKYYAANQEAVEDYRRLCSEIDCDFEPTDSYVYSVSDSSSVLREMKALSRLSIPADYCECEELPFKSFGAVRFENQAQFNPLRFVSHIAKGLNIYEKTKVKSIEGRTAFTENSRIDSKIIVVATHFPFLNKRGLYFLKMYQHRSYVAAVEGASIPKGMFVSAERDGFSLRSYGDFVLVGGGAHRTGKSACGWGTVEEFVKKYYPKAEIKYEWAAQDAITLDGIPYIGNYSSTTPNLYVITGFNKWGMTSAMVGSKIIRDLILGRKNGFAEVFSPSRRILRPALFSNGIEAAKGLLTFGKPRCTHLGCALKWNKYEHSWDCSCHGSRFSEDGKILDNPANSDYSD